MSQLHIRQIRNTLNNLHCQIDLSDYSNKPQEQRESAYLSRAQAVFILSYLTGIETQRIADNLTDGAQDNGIDLIYYHSHERALYLVQSKWTSTGKGSPNRGDIQKFLTGFRDLVNARWDRFNNKVESLSDTLESALNDASTRIVLIFTHTGQNNLSDEVQRDINDLLDEVNDPTELVTFEVMRQGDIYAAISQGIEGAAIDTDLALYEWGYVSDPYPAYYGQLAASDIAQLYHRYHSRILAPNIRMFLGPTDVNTGMIETLQNEPESFWYFNNGITALCRTITKKPLGGASKDSGYFECRDLRIVNGAQTVGAISSANNKSPEQVAQARLNIRIVSLENCPEDFEKEVTRYNNTQNRIDKRDFVALDTQQERLQRELAIEGVQYIYKSGDVVGSTSSAFDLTEATVARACRQNSSQLAVQAKREIGRLWDDITQTPYTVLFNGGLSSTTLWRQVLILRSVEQTLSHYKRKEKARRRLLAVHGNRFIAHLTMQCMNYSIVDAHGPLNQSEQDDCSNTTERIYEEVYRILENHYPDSYLGSLFKNARKCSIVQSIFQCPT